MKIAYRNNIPLFQFTKFLSHQSIDHFISGREGGISTGNFSSLNLGYKSGDDRKNVSKNWSLLCKALNIPDNKLLFPIQTHSKNIKIITEDIKVESYQDIQDKFPDTDGFITNRNDIYIAVLLADCVPVILFDPNNKIIAVVHSGWRGTIKNIVGHAIDLMESEFQCKSENILIGIGPSIGQDAFEVGPEVTQEFVHTFGDNAHSIIEKKEKDHINLWNAIKIQCVKKGIPEKNIEISGICNYSNPEDFYSYRQQKGTTGRFAAGIRLL